MQPTDPPSYLVGIMRLYLFFTAAAIFFGLAGFFGLGAGIIGFILWGVAVLFALFAIMSFFNRKKAKENAAAHSASAATADSAPH